jgi:hypothetical protein
MARTASWLTHRGGRLEDAERLRLRPDLAGLLAPADWTYLAACRTRKVEEKEREEQRRKRELWRNRIIAYGSLTAFVVVSALSWFFFQQWRAAQVTQSRFLADLTHPQVEKGDAATGMLLALEALPDSAASSPVQRFRPYVPEAEYALDAA